MPDGDYGGFFEQNSFSGFNPTLIGAVIVTYQPKVKDTLALVATISPQVGPVVIVDNGSSQQTVQALLDSCKYTGTKVIALGQNLGLAAAQNRGVEWLRCQGVTEVLLLDQDSLPAADMVERLLAGREEHLSRLDHVGILPAAHPAKFRPLAAVGPAGIDPRDSQPLISVDGRWGPTRYSAGSQDSNLVIASYVIASGCLIPLTVWDTVGPMNEGFFIDQVDLEWGLRARKAGFQLAAVLDATLHHQLGDKAVNLPGRSRPVHVHSPRRNYFMVRNTLFLMRGPLLSGQWKLGYAVWLCKYFAFYLLLVPGRRKRLPALFTALKAGLTQPPPHNPAV